MNNSLHRWFLGAIGTVWFIALLSSLVFLAFSNTQIFYSKINIDPSIFRKQGNTYFLSFDNPFGVYNPKSLIILEDGKYLKRTFSNDPRYNQEGTYYIYESNQNLISGNFTPSLPSKSGNHNSEYFALIKFGAIYGNNLGRWAIFFCIGTILFYLFINSKRVLQAKNRFLPKPLLSFFVNLRLINITKEERIRFFSKSTILKSIALVITTSIALVFSEWLFLVSKSSYLDIFPFSMKIEILFSSFFLIGLVASLLFFIFLVIGFFVSQYFPSFGIYFTQIPSALLCVFLIMLLCDNFFYTLFFLEIGGSTNIVRLVFSLVSFIIFLLFLNKAVMFLTSRDNPKLHTLFIISSLVVFSISAFLTAITTQKHSLLHFDYPISSSLNQYPNIILISSDGIEAKNLSLYGYARDTTPFLRDLGKVSLVGENHFTNSNYTYGSLISALTGKSSFSTKVLYSPNILRGEDAFQHLPGILKNLGYRTISLGAPYYADVNVMNFQDAFDEVNCTDHADPLLSSPIMTEYFQYESYLLGQIKKRIKDRFFHIYFIEDYKSPFIHLNFASGNAVSDQDRMGCLKTYLRESNKNGQPIFIQIHQMSTHGPRFDSAIRTFSKNSSQESEWMTDFYDDSINNFDSQISNLYSNLNSLDLLEKTILIIYSDHGMKWSSTNPIPLLIHFPNNQFSGRIGKNTQNLDIAPTILDYLGIQIPEWMEGSSLLSPIPPDRTIFSVKPVEAVQISGLWTMPKNITELPFKQLESIKAIQCQKITSIDLQKFSIEESEVEEYMTPCSEDSLYSRGEIIDKVAELLARAGYPLPEDWKNLK